MRRYALYRVPVLVIPNFILNNTLCSYSCSPAGGSTAVSTFLQQPPLAVSPWHSLTLLWVVISPSGRLSMIFWYFYITWSSLHMVIVLLHSQYVCRIAVQVFHIFIIISRPTHLWLCPPIVNAVSAVIVSVWHVSTEATWHKAEHPTTSSERKQESISLKAKPTDSNWHGWVWMHFSVCVSIWHILTICAVCVCVMLGHKWQTQCSWLMPVPVDV